MGTKFRPLTTFQTRRSKAATDSTLQASPTRTGRLCQNHKVVLANDHAMVWLCGKCESLLSSLQLTHGLAQRQISITARMPVTADAKACPAKEERGIFRRGTLPHGV